MVVMDGAIVNVALPAMAADLGLSVIGQQWVIDAYLIALGGFMLLSARLGDLYGRRRMLQLGLTLFTAASLIGGLAGDGASLLAARAAQGLGASVLATSTLAVIASAYPKGKARDRAIGYWTASGSMAAAFGVLLGGVLTAYAGWRWVMFVNVPVGLVLLAMTAATLSAPERGGERPVLDIAGAVTVTGASACLVYALAESVTLGWDAREVLEYLVGALALGLLFVAIEMGVRQPLVRLGIFRLRNVAIGNLMLMGLGATLTSSLFFLSIALHQISGYGVRDTGLAMLPMCLAIAATALGARALNDRSTRRQERSEVSAPYWRDGDMAAMAASAWS
jgi:MFS family permease